MDLDDAGTAANVRPMASTPVPLGAASRKMRPSPALRLGAFMSLGARAVHQCRYAACYDDQAEHALAAEGHADLGLAGPVIALLLALACG